MTRQSQSLSVSWSNAIGFDQMHTCPVQGSQWRSHSLYCITTLLVVNKKYYNTTMPKSAHSVYIVCKVRSVKTSNSWVFFTPWCVSRTWTELASWQRANRTSCSNPSDRVRTVSNSLLTKRHKKGEMSHTYNSKSIRETCSSPPDGSELIFSHSGGQTFWLVGPQ